MKTKTNIFFMFFAVISTGMFFLPNCAKAGGSGWENVGLANFSPDAAYYTKIAFNPSTNEPYVAYQDFGNSGEATVMKFDGSAWVAVGSAGFSDGGADNINLAFNPSTNEPYVAYRESMNKVTVMRFNGSAWVLVGSAGFSSTVEYFVSFAFNPSTNEPYVAYEDKENSNKITVMRFHNSSWELVGLAGFSTGEVGDIDLAFNPSTNEPYVAYKDMGSSYKATVMKFNGSSWVTVGSAGFSADNAYSISLAFNPSTNEPYVAYCDDGSSGKVTVMKFSETVWTAVGSVGFSAGDSIYSSLAFNPLTNEPYVAYQDGGNSDKITAMKFNGSAWVTVGSAGFSEEGAIPADISLAFNPSTGDPYVAYYDDGPSLTEKGTVMRHLDGVESPTASPAAEAYDSAQSVTLSTTTSGATIYYTTDGNDPTISSTQYSSPISISSSTTLKAIAIKSGMWDSNVFSGSYIINLPGTVAAPTASPTAGTYDSGQSVTLSTTTEGATIYYTTDGSDPNSVPGQWSAIYTSPIAISESTTIRAYALKSGMVDSDRISLSYTIDKHSSEKKETIKPRTITNSKRFVKNGQILIQRGKKFSKNSIVKLYFGKFGGGYYAPMEIKTSSSGSFMTAYRVNKPKGTYYWYALDTKTGKKSKTIWYRVR